MIVKRNSLVPFDFGGLEIFDYTAGQRLSSSLAVIEVPPNSSHPEAWSKRSDKYYWVARGEVRFMLERESFDLASGDCCIVERGRRFSYSNVREQPATLVLLHTPSFELDAETFAERR
jgi:mannose-6-phosphate isomerase-like protein (cupin superfamily)